jgi:hypothetical protein
MLTPIDGAKRIRRNFLKLDIIDPLSIGSPDIGLFFAKDKEGRKSQKDSRLERYFLPSD